MKANRGDVVIGIKVMGDPSNPGALRGIGTKVKKAQEEATKASTEQAQKAAEQREKIETASLIRLEKNAKRRADLAIQYEKRVHDESAKYWTARIRREQQADRDLVRRGTIMAREIDKEIRLREQAEKRLATARQRSVQRRQAAASVGTSEMVYGGLQAGRGLLELGLSHSIANTPSEQRQTENLIQGLVAIQGGFDVASGGYRAARGLGMAAPGLRRTVNRMGSRLLQAGEYGAGALGIGLGAKAIAGTTVGAAGALGAAGVGAALGVGAAGFSIFSNARDMYRYGFMGGATPGSYNAMAGNALAGVGGWIGEAAGYDPQGNLALSRASTDAARKRQMTIAQESARQYQEQIGGINAQFSEQTNAMGLSAAIEQNQRRYGSAMGRARADLGAVRGQLGSLRGQTGGTDTERLSREQQIVSLMQKEEALLRSMAGIQQQTQDKRLSMYAGAQAGRQGDLQSSRGTLRAFAEAGTGDQARIKSILERYKVAGSIKGFSAEEIAIIRRFGGRDINNKIDREGDAIGAAGLAGFAGKDYESDQKRIKAGAGAIRGSSRGFDMVTPPGKERAGGAAVNSTINMSINIERGLNEAADRVRTELMEALNRLKEEMKRIAERDADRGQQAGSAAAASQ